MPHEDPLRIEETCAWFRKAGNDLRGARLDLDAEPPLIEDALFHCQQAVEKVLKGFLAWHDQAFRRTHDLLELGTQCIQLDPTLEPICRKAEPLTVFAALFRYPGDCEVPPADEGEEALSLAREAFESLLSRLPDQVRQRFDAAC